MTKPNLVLKPKSCFIPYYYEFYFINYVFDCKVVKKYRRGGEVISVDFIDESVFLAFRKRCLENGFFMDSFFLGTESESD
jgi:hypothetical protein